jgi:mannosylglycerate hydrolase
MPFNAIKLHPPAVTAPKEYSLLVQLDEDAVVSAVKRREDGRGIILRFYNPTSRETFASFHWKGPLQSVCRTRLDERPVSSLEHHRGRFSVPVKPNEVQTVSVFDRSGAD